MTERIDAPQPLTAVLSPAALEHWEQSERRRARHSDRGCVCMLCESVPLILRALADGPGLVQGGATEAQIEAAARTEAERRHVPLDRPTAVNEQCAVQGFVDGAKWSASASAHPADERHDAEGGEPARAANTRERVLAVLNEYSIEHYHPEYGVGLFTTCSPEIADALSAESEDHAAKVTPIVQCSDGLCPNGCSHLMWSCAKCSCEGGWGAEREKLEALSAAHVCPEPHAATVTGDREKLTARLRHGAEVVDWYSRECTDTMREAADALAARVEVDEAKLAEIVYRVERDTVTGSGQKRRRLIASAIASHLRGESDGGS